MSHQLLAFHHCEDEVHVERNFLYRLVWLNKPSNIRETASSNYDEGKEVSLTQKQMIDICRELNGQVLEEDVKNSKIFQKTKFGTICLN